MRQIANSSTVVALDIRLTRKGCLATLPDHELRRPRCTTRATQRMRRIPAAAMWGAAAAAAAATAAAAVAAAVGQGSPTA